MSRPACIDRCSAHRGLLPADCRCADVACGKSRCSHRGAGASGCEAARCGSSSWLVLSEAETKTPAPSLHRAEAGPSRVLSETAGHCDALSSFLPGPRIAEGSLDCLETCRCSRRLHHGAECRTLPRLVKVLAAAISLPWHAAFSSPDEAQRALARLTAGEISDDLEGQV